MSITIRIERSTHGAPVAKPGLPGAFGITDPGAGETEAVEISIPKSGSLDEAGRVASKMFNASHGILTDGRAAVETELADTEERYATESAASFFSNLLKETAGRMQQGGVIVVDNHDSTEDIARKVAQSIRDAVPRAGKCGACDVDHGADAPAESDDNKGEPKLSEF